MSVNCVLHVNTYQHGYTSAQVFLVGVLVVDMSVYVCMDMCAFKCSWNHGAGSRLHFISSASVVPASF